MATDLQMQQDLNGRLQRDVERFNNRAQLLAKVGMGLKGNQMACSFWNVVCMQGFVCDSPAHTGHQRVTCTGCKH